MSIKSDSPLHKYVVEYIHSAWGTKDYFPGPQPISIEYKHFPILKSGDYVVCEKTKPMGSKSHLYQGAADILNSNIWTYTV